MDSKYNLEKLHVLNLFSKTFFAPQTEDTSTGLSKNKTNCQSPAVIRLMTVATIVDENPVPHDESTLCLISLME